MRKWLVILTLVIAFYLDRVFFNMLNLYGIRPDITLAVIVSFGVLAGSGPAAAAGFITGLLADILFNKIVGLTGLAYMLSGFFAGFFYRKFYADNIIIPTVLCLICFFVKEHIFLVASLIAGAKPSYFMTLITYILPSLLLTGGTVILIHLFFKKTLYKSLWRNEAIDVN